ncbi:hypothetical protein, partial [Streptomyces sp. RP5T]|uniref:hypothetical protein n=1 Tax=Streptomyces sp. RP5T TaxID=2490848 RepID=UPI001C8C2559
MHSQSMVERGKLPAPTRQRGTRPLISVTRRDTARRLTMHRRRSVHSQSMVERGKLPAPTQQRGTRPLI